MDRLHQHRLCRPAERKAATLLTPTPISVLIRGQSPRIPTITFGLKIDHVILIAELLRELMLCARPQGSQSPLMSPAKRKRFGSDMDTEGSARMVILPSSRTGTNTSNTTTNTAVTARGSPPKRFDDVDPLGPEGDQAEQSQDDDVESTDENERDSAGLDYEMQDRSWHDRNERARYNSLSRNRRTGTLPGWAAVSYNNPLRR